MTGIPDGIGCAREQTDMRIRRTAGVAAALCWVAAALSLALAAWSLFSAAWLTWASSEASGADLVTSFFVTSEASGDFTFAEYGAREPDVTYDDEGRETGRSQLLGGTVSMSGSPIRSLCRGAAFGGLSCAAFAVAALLCTRIRRSGEVFSPVRTRELGRVGVLVLLAGCVPPLLHFALESIGAAVVHSLVESGSMVSYALTAHADVRDLMLVALGALIVLVARVFEYGCILQRQDDELL